MQSNISIAIIFIFILANLTIGHRILTISSLLASSSSDRTTPPGCDVLDDYNNARKVRIKCDTSAIPMYKELVSKYKDITAASRIAAASSSPKRHDQTCPLPNVEDPNDDIMNAILRMKSILEESSYNNQCIQRIFGIKPLASPMDLSRQLTKSESLGVAKGPVYIKPIPSRAQSKLPIFLEDLDTEPSSSSLKCLVALFLLGFAVPREILARGLIGGNESIHLLEILGLAFPCEIDPSIIVPYVHIFPLQIDILGYTDSGSPEVGTNKPLILVTDCHPTILSQTTVGTNEDGAVMYIGPDSLALVQHKPIQFHIMRMMRTRWSTSSNQMCKDDFNILDFCTGSGIQALSTLKSLEIIAPKAKALCVDINDRALRFTQFNAFLNGIGGDRINVIKADLASGTILKPESDRNLLDHLCNESEIQPHELIGPFDIILSNPPFIPTPPKRGDSRNDLISKRYGLFSSGGSSGENILRCVVAMSSRLLRRNNGLMAIVSEFMNPPIESYTEEGKAFLTDELLQKISDWWQAPFVDNLSCESICIGKGLLFTNQEPVSASKYASRRADDGMEYSSWMQNLDAQKIHCVSPGLLYIRSDDSSHTDKESISELESRLVPRDNEMGSIWTPYNYKAVCFVQKEWERYMH